MRLLGIGYLAAWIVFAWIVAHPAQPRQIPAPLWYDALNLGLEVGWFVVGCMVGFRLLAGERVGFWAFVLVLNIAAAVLASVVAVLVGVELAPGGPKWSSGQELISVLLFAALIAVPVLILFQENPT